jgi:hypothetical protein
MRNLSILYAGACANERRLQKTVWNVALFLLVCCLTNSVNGQRFLRQGFSNNEDFGAEMKIEDKENAVDMTREMFLMQNLQWQIQTPFLHDNYGKIRNASIRRHIQKYIGNQAIDIRLQKKRGKYGLCALGRTDRGKMLRAFWRQSVATNAPLSTTTTTTRGIDFLKASYDDACRSRLFTVEFEIQLPSLTTKHAKNGAPEKVFPSIVYQVSLEPGSMNPKALVPRSAGRVFVYPTRNKINERIEVGKAYVSSAPIKPGMVDPSWAKGKPIFRKGRNSGLM